MFKILKENCPECIYAINCLFPLLESRYPFHSKDDIKHVSASGSAKLILLILDTEVQLSQMQQQLEKTPSIPTFCQVWVQNKLIQ